MQQILDKTPYESILEAKGVVTGRPPGSEQKALDTGKVEVVVQEINILNRAKTQLPFNVREYNKAKEPLRMEHRYLNLRFPDMQRNLRIRSRLLMDMRDYLVNKADFVDVETPTLFRATPGVSTVTVNSIFINVIEFIVAGCARVHCADEDGRAVLFSGTESSAV